MQHANASKTLRQPSLIEVINQGFQVVNRHLWVLLIPLLVDIYYWLGPRISFVPLLRRLQAMDPQLWDTLSQQVSDQLGAAIEQLDLRQFAFLPFVRPLAQSITTPAPLFEPLIWQIDSWSLLLGTLGLINLVSLASVALYLSPLADSLRIGDRLRLRLGRIGRVFVVLLGIVLIFIGVTLMTLIPFILAAGFAALINPVWSQFIFFFWTALFFWLLFMASFSFDAVVINNVGPLRAMLNSLSVIRRFFWGAIGLLVLTRLILGGLSIIWQALAANTGGLLLAMVGSAYISSGLAAAHLIFYRDRLSRIAQPPTLSQSS